LSRYAKPTTVDDALALLAEGRWRILAGGTDFYPALGSDPLVDDVLDLGGLAALRGITETAGHLVIGAATTWSELAAARLPAALGAWQQAAAAIGSVQIQNVATVAGNLGNASPAADGVPALLIVDAEVELSAAGGVRHLPLREFIRGNRRTALAADELITAIRVPNTALAGASVFTKLGARRYMVISIAMVAVRLAADGHGTIREAAVAVGACSPVALRLAALEAELIGRRLDSLAGDVVSPAYLSALAPLDDVRGSAEYRLAAARELVARTLGAAAARAAEIPSRTTVAA